MDIDKELANGAALRACVALKCLDGMTHHMVVMEHLVVSRGMNVALTLQVSSNLIYCASLFKFKDF